MKPKIGDMVHFRSVCAACNRTGMRHFTFVLDDPDLLAMLPEFKKRLHSYDKGREINIWWDHSPSVFEVYKITLDGVLLSLLALVKHRETHGYEDTYLILLSDDYVSLSGPSRSIIPLTSDEIENAKVAQVVSRMNISHFNYIDFTRLKIDEGDGQPNRGTAGGGTATQDCAEPAPSNAFLVKSRSRSQSGVVSQWSANSFTWDTEGLGELAQLPPGESTPVGDRWRYARYFNGLSKRVRVLT